MTVDHEQSAVRVEGLSLEYEVGFPVLWDLDLRVRQGTISALLGRSGCGKSTLMQCLYGLLEPEHGRCEVLGLTPSEEPVALRRRVGYVPQSPQFYPGMSAEAHLDLIRPLYGRRWNRDFENALVREFDLELKLHQRVKDLSPGQQRQFSLVTALAFEPDLLLLDEPTVYLDVVVRRQFAKQLVEFSSQPGRTVLMASHMIHEIERLADHVFIMENRTTLLASSLEDLKRDLYCFEAAFDHPRDLEEDWQLAKGYWRSDTFYGAVWTQDTTTASDIEQRLMALGANQVNEVDPSLESLFVHLTSGA